MGRRRGTMWFGAALAGIMAITMVSSAFASSQTLAQVKARGSLVCGVNEGCRGSHSSTNAGSGPHLMSISAAPSRPPYLAIRTRSSSRHFPRTRGFRRCGTARSTSCPAIDLDDGARNRFGLTFVGVTYYDGQGFMVPRAIRINSALELDGAKVCVQSGTTTIDNLADFFASNGMALEQVVSSSTDESVKNYDAGLCLVLTSDLSQLYALRLRLSKPRDHVILPDVISKEPRGPVVRDNDLQWINIVKWVYFAMINAEELGVNSRNIGQALQSQKPEVRRLVGTDGTFGEQIGLTNALGCEHHPRRRQLRRGVRAQPRLEDPARHPPRAQSIVERRRHSIRAADPVRPSKPRRSLEATVATAPGGNALAALALSLHRSRRTGVSLLPVDAPIAQFVDRDRLAGNGAAHIDAGRTMRKSPSRNSIFASPASMGRRSKSVHCQSSRFDCSMP